MSHSNPSHRYAIYFAPQEGSQLHQSASLWLGRDAVAGVLTEPELPPTISHAAWRATTEDPRRYGFHATLKPPFQLATGASAEALKDSLQKFSDSHKAFRLPPLTLGTLGHFLALILSAPSPCLHQLAAECVRDLDPFRAPSDAADLAKRVRPSHNLAEQQNLIRWGYPYVLDTWKFHMTLTNSLKPEELELSREHIAERFSEVCNQPLLCDSICLFEEPTPGAPFLLTARFPLAP
jgi:putative phosphonate metabolism protein